MVIYLVDGCLSQMDVAGGILASKIAKGRVATVAIEGMKFLLPVKVGDTVTCYGKLEKVGKPQFQ